MSTSGSTIGTRPTAMIWRAIANCWVTTSLMPASLACLMNERIFVPKMRLAFALSSSDASSGIGFMSWTPRLSAARPLSTFRNGTIRLDQLVEGMLPVGSRLSPVDGPGRVTDLHALARDVLAVALHGQLLQVRGKPLEVLFVGQDRHRLRAEEIGVPDGQQAQEHGQVALERGRAEV